MRSNKGSKGRKVHPEEAKEESSPPDEVETLFADIEHEFAQLLSVGHDNETSTGQKISKSKHKGERKKGLADDSEDEDDENGEAVELGYGNVSKSDVMAVEELKSQFKRLEEQMKAMKSKYNTILTASHQQEIKNKELSVQIETLEEENKELQNALTQRVENGAAAPSGSRPRRRGPRISGAKKPKDEALRAGLLEDEEEGEDIGEDLDVFGENKKDLLIKVLNWCIKKTPFQNDIREMHATFGGAVAAYFLFFRWM